jgi:hypothetical protein
MSKRLQKEKVEAYLTGQLPPEEARAFERDMAGDEALATEVELQRLEHDAMELLLEKQLKSRMADWKNNPPPNPFEVPLPPPPSNNGSWKKWLPFLGLAILVFSGLWYFLRQDDVPIQPNNWPVDTPAAPSTPQQQSDAPVATDDEKGKTDVPETPTPPKTDKLPVKQETAYIALANDNYDVAEFSSGLKGGGSEKSVFELAAEAFDAKQYLKAVELLAQKEAGNESQVRYLRGHALFNLKRYGQAATEFKAVADNEFAPDFLSAQWYLALSYLAQGSSARVQFLKLAGELADAKNQHPRQVDAAKLLERFNAL